MKDVVIGAVKGHSWPKIEAYAISLCRSGFTGTKLLFVDKTPQSTKDILKRLGFELVELSALPAPPHNIHFNVDRFFYVWQWMAANEHHFMHAIWTDVRDVVFQTDPSAWLEQNRRDKYIIAGSENILLKDEPANRQWIYDMFGQDVVDELWEKRVCNGGTFAGTCGAMTILFKDIYTLCCNMPQTLPQRDQAALNVLLRRPPYTIFTHIPYTDEGFAAICHGIGQPQKFIGKLTDPVPTIRDGVLYNIHGNKFCIVHQYDRNKEWQAAILRRYRQ